jgi:hypothetical protein
MTGDRFKLPKKSHEDIRLNSLDGAVAAWGYVGRSHEAAHQHD